MKSPDIEYKFGWPDMDPRIKWGLAKSAQVDGPQSGGGEAAQESGSRPESERSERALMRTSSRSKLHGADSVQADGAFNQCGQCGRDISSCQCDFGV